eukprot:TRINITY_DN1406_c0_g1_i1.p1 TRINITY_DN1406_c0_g1~~TRINITY_DN1406_c0_g1_i1.p1  ORF type:complete len:142 (-),score=46.47 TRINITY_DN1406_c0_g1_i1:78-503(-)
MEEETTWKEAFSLFDRDGDGNIKIEELGTVFRALGQNPTQAEVEEIKKEAGGSSCDFEKFKGLMRKYKKEPPQEKDIREAFKVFDKDGNGVLSASELKNVLTTMGEKLQEDEVDGILKNLNKNGVVQLDDLIQILMKPTKK